MKKFFLVLLAIVAMASTATEAKSTSKSTAGCWSFEAESDVVQPNSGRLYSYGFKAHLRRSKG